MRNHFAGWTNTVLGEVCSFKSGSGFKENYQGMKTGQHPFIKVRDLTLSGNEKYIKNAQNWISGKALKELRAKLQPARATVFAKVGAALKLNRRRILTRPTAIDNNMMAAIPDETRLNHEFLYFFLLIQDLGCLSQEGAVPSVNQQHLAEINIGLPPLSEQCKIAKILSTWDYAIETTEKLISNTQDQKKALKWQLLKGRRRFITGKGEWKVVSFGDVMDIKIGGTPSRNNSAYWDHEKNTENRWVSISDLQSPSIEETKEHLSDLGVKNSNAKLIPAGSIVMSFKLTIGRTAVLGKACYTNEAVCAILPKDEKLLLKDYLLQALPYVNYEKEIDQAVKGKTLNKKKLRNLKLALPPYEEQRRIADVLSALDSKESILISSRAKLELEKGELMRGLLTGKRRVRVDDDSND